MTKSTSPGRTATDTLAAADDLVDDLFGETASTGLFVSAAQTLIDRRDRIFAVLVGPGDLEDPPDIDKLIQFRDELEDSRALTDDDDEWDDDERDDDPTWFESAVDDRQDAHVERGDAALAFDTDAGSMCSYLEGLRERIDLERDFETAFDALGAAGAPFRDLHIILHYAYARHLDDSLDRVDEALEAWESFAAEAAAEGF